jgi:hypothetical protein
MYAIHQRLLPQVKVAVRAAKQDVGIIPLLRLDRARSRHTLAAEHGHQ